jgi:hypothetical protein
MKRTVKSLVAFGLVLVFALAVLCATLAAPGQSLASVNGCSQDNRAMEMSDCEHPSYLCGFDPSSRLISEGAFSSTRSNDSLKNPLGLAVGDACFDSSAYGGPFVRNEHTSAFPVTPHKVSIHLYNSVFTL